MTDYGSNLMQFTASLARLQNIAVARPVAIDPISHAAQTMHGASGDLLDLVRHAESREDVERIGAIAAGLAERLQAIHALAQMRAEQGRADADHCDSGR